MGNLIDLLLEESDFVPKYQIYCDMDGVLTDFEERFEHFSGMKPEQYEAKHGAAGFWELIDNKVGVKFWVGMGWMSGGRELWNFISKYDAKLLSSPSRHDNSRLSLIHI